MRRRVGHTIAGRRQHPTHPASSVHPRGYQSVTCLRHPKISPGHWPAASGSCSRIIPGPTWRSSAASWASPVSSFMPDRVGPGTAKEIEALVAAHDPVADHDLLG